MGASIEITSKILDEPGIEWSASYESPWRRALKNAENGKIDLISGLEFVTERTEYLNYTSVPFSTNPVAVFSLASTVLEDINKFAAKLTFEDTLIHHGFSKKSSRKAIEPAFSAKLQEYFESGMTEATLKKYEQI